MTRSGGRRSGLKKLTAALIVLIAVGAIAVGVIDNSDDNGHHITAEFVDASPLIVGSDVRMDGVKVGEITSMSVNPDGRANVGLSLDDSAYPLHTDARVTIKPVSLLGERYLDLQRGSATAPVLTGDVLYPDHTGTSTDLDEVLNTVDDPTGNALAALVTMLGDGMQGNGANTAATIKALAPAVNKTNGLMSILDQQNTLLQQTVDSITPVASALSTDDGKTLDRLTGVADSLLGTTAAKQLALQETLGSLPGTLQTARSTLATLTGTANAAMPALQSLRPTTDNLTQISSELQAFADSADPALASAKPVLAKANALLKQAYPVVSALNTAGPAAVSDAHSLRPLVGDLTSNVTNVLNFIKYWALSTNGYDGLSHYFRAMVVVTPLSATGLLPGLGSTSPTTTATPGRKTTTKTPTQNTQGTDPISSVLQPVTGLLGGLLSPTTSKDGSVTGLDKNQEQGALGSLLGLLGGS